VAWTRPYHLDTASVSGIIFSRPAGFRRKNLSSMKPLIAQIFSARGFVKGVLVPAALLAATVPCGASVITWGLAQEIAADTDVSTNGSLVAAFNIGGIGVSDTTVNGVTFVGLAISGNDFTSGNFNFAGALDTTNSAYVAGPFGLSASYEVLISSALRSLAFPFTLTMSGLVPGATYEFQWWCNANGGTGGDTTATAGNSIYLSGSSGDFDVLRRYPGHFAIGAFVADATTTQSIVFTTSFFHAMNGFQLRETSSVPDTASTVALFALGLIGLGFLARHVTWNPGMKLDS
jgi:hypothetical protein